MIWIQLDVNQENYSFHLICSWIWVEKKCNQDSVVDMGFRYCLKHFSNCIWIEIETRTSVLQWNNQHPSWFSRQKKCALWCSTTATGNHPQMNVPDSLFLSFIWDFGVAVFECEQFAFDNSRYLLSLGCLIFSWYQFLKTLKVKPSTKWGMH